MDNKTYYLFLDNQQKGPYSKENLQVMYRAGKIDEYTQVWTEDLGEWVELRGYSDIVGMVATKKVHPSASSPGRATRRISRSRPMQGYNTTVVQPQGSNGLATGSLVCSFISLLFCPPLFGVIAFILAICAICSCPNKGYAVVTLILSIVFPIIGMVFGVMIMELFAK